MESLPEDPVRQPLVVLALLLSLAVDVLLVPDVCASAMPAASKNVVSIVFICYSLFYLPFGHCRFGFTPGRRGLNQLTTYVRTKEMMAGLPSLRRYREESSCSHSTGICVIRIADVTH